MSGNRPSPRAAVYALFALSGGAGLVLELSWSRQLGLVLGNTAPVVSVVLAAYFAGMAGGQAIGSRLAPRVRPLAAYGVCELVTAAWGVAVPSLLRWGGDRFAAEWAGERSLELTAAWCVAVLLPATLSLGATLPLIAEHFAPGGESAGRRISLAYASNTVGGLFGVVAATGGLLVSVGVAGSGFVAAAMAAVSGFSALGFAAAGGRSGERRSVPVPPAPHPSRPALSWTALAAVSGFGTLGLEVLYSRLFALVFHNSVYSFGAVLVAFVAGLGLASLVVAAASNRVRPMPLALVCGGLGALAVPVSLVLFVRLTGLESFNRGESFAGYLAAAFALAAAVVVPPVTLFGTALPAAFAAGGPAGGRVVGRLAAVNALFAAAGALAAGFVLLPGAGLWWSFGLLSVAFALPPVFGLARGRRVLAAGVFAAAVAAAVAVAAAGPEQAGDQEGGRGEEIVRRWETPYGWIDVVRASRDGSLSVRENLHYRHGSTGGSATREYRQGRLPLLLHPRPAEVAFLGLGTGLTAAPVVADRGVERAVVVELIPEVVQAARLLSRANLGVVDCPKVAVRVDDARHFLRRTDRTFDLIVSDLFVPWESRAGYLYTVEHFAAARRRLRPGGLFCQWVALYQAGPAEFELIADSFASVFPNTSVWWGQFDARFPIVALVGSDSPLAVDPTQLAARWDALGDPPGGPDADLSSPAALVDFYVGDWPTGSGRPLNTDEHPRLEFAAPVSQRSGRTLTGPRLRAYYDRVLAELPADGVRFGGKFAVTAEPDRRRQVQRLSLFGPAAAY